MRIPEIWLERVKATLYTANRGRGRATRRRSASLILTVGSRLQSRNAVVAQAPCRNRSREYDKSVSAIIRVATPACEISVEARPGYVSVVGHGTVATLVDADRMQQQIDAALRKRLRPTFALFDQRALELPDQAVRDIVWDHLISQFDRCALVVATEMLGVQANMTALLKGARLRAFNSKVMAARWLLQV